MCPPKKSVLARNLFEPYAHSFEDGGLVQHTQSNIPRSILKHNDPDVVYARLQPNEIVIPVKHAPLVSKFLKQKNIRLPNM